MCHILSLCYVDDSVCSLHIFRCFLAAREEADILWKVCSKNLNPVTKPKHSTGIKPPRKQRFFSEVGESDSRQPGRVQLAAEARWHCLLAALAAGTGQRVPQRAPLQQQLAAAQH